MPIDPSISLNANRPDTLADIGKYISIGRQKQALTREQETLESDIAKSKAESSRTQTEANVATRTADNRVDQQAAITSTAKTGAESARFNLTNEQAQAGLNEMGGLFSNEHIKAASDPKYWATLTPDEQHKRIDDITKSVRAARERSIERGVPEVAAERFAQGVLKVAHDDPSQLQNYLGNVIRAGTGAQGQASIAPGQNVAMGNGQQTTLGQVQPLAGPTGPQSQFTTQQQVPVGTPTINPNTQAPAIVGPNAAVAPPSWNGPGQAQPQGGPVPMPQPGQPPAGGPPGMLNGKPMVGADQFPRVAPGQQQANNATQAQLINQEFAKAVQAGDWQKVAAIDAQAKGAGIQLNAPGNGAPPPPAPSGMPGAGAPPAPGAGTGPGGATYMQTGAAPMQKSTLQTVSEDMENSAKAAAGASERIGILQRIRGLSDTAIVGSQSDKRQLVAGIASYFGNQGAAAASADTDEFIKNTARLVANEPGGTDAARAIAEMASPNQKMQGPAIKAATNYLIARDTLAQEKVRVLKEARESNNPNLYNDAVQQWNKAANPVVVQWAHADGAERMRIVHGMSPEDQTRFRQQLGQLRKWGVVPGPQEQPQ